MIRLPKNRISVPNPEIRHDTLTPEPTLHKQFLAPRRTPANAKPLDETRYRPVCLSQNGSCTQALDTIRLPLSHDVTRVQRGKLLTHNRVTLKTAFAMLFDHVHRRHDPNVTDETLERYGRIQTLNLPPGPRKLKRNGLG